MAPRHLGQYLPLTLSPAGPRVSQPVYHTTEADSIGVAAVVDIIIIAILVFHTEVGDWGSFVLYPQYLGKQECGVWMVDDMVSGVDG